MNIHLPAILMFTRGTRFWHTAIYVQTGQMIGRLHENSMRVTSTLIRRVCDDPDRSVPYFKTLEAPHMSISAAFAMLWCGYCNILQHIATYCNILQHIATYCNILQHIATYCNILQHIATSADTFANVLSYCNILLVLQGISRRASCTSDILGEHWRNVGTSSVSQPLLVDHDMGLWLSTWIVIIPWSWSLCYTIQYNQYTYWGVSLSITTHGNPMKSSQYFHAFADLEDPWRSVARLRLLTAACPGNWAAVSKTWRVHVVGWSWWSGDPTWTNHKHQPASTSISQHQSTSIINQPASSDSNQH